MKSIVVLICYIIFTTGFDVTELTILSTVKHLKNSMKYANLGVDLKDTQNLLRMFNFHQIFSGCHQSCIFDDSVKICKLLDRRY